jgi:type IV secretory pathway TrbL component
MHWMFGVGLGNWLKTWLSVLEDALKLFIIITFVSGLLINLDAILLQSGES